MKFFTLPALGAAALVSAVLALPFLPAAKTRPDLFVLEARLTASGPGQFQAYFDDGGGLREALSSQVTLSAATGPTVYRLPIPPGTYRALRLDPPERGVTIAISELRVVSQTGRVLATVPLTNFKPAQQVAALAMRGNELVLTSAANSEDAQVVTFLEPPVVIYAGWREYTRGSLPWLLAFFAALAGTLLLLDRAPPLRGWFVARAERLAAAPGRAVCIAAAVAVVASAYPVVFLGKSYVSPNLGTILLYDMYPTLPGYKSGEVVDVKLADVGAVMWQHVPFSMMQHRALLHGELPLWNRYNAAGVPLLAQGQSMAGDPLHFLVIAANGAAWAWDLKYLIAKWLFASALGLIVLTLVGPKDQGTKGPRDQRAFDTEASPLVPWSFGPLVPALIVSAAAPFIGFFIYRVNHPAFFSLCYAPWPLYCLVRIAQAETRRGLAGWCAGLVVANLAVMNSGTVKEAYMLLACVNLAGGLVLLLSAAPWRDRLRKLAAVAWTGAIFVLLTAPIWATFLQTLKNAYTGYNAVSAYQIQPSLLLGLFDEIFYRPLMEQNRVFSPSLNFLLLLGFLYFLATLRTHFANRAVLALAVSSLLPLALAFGLVSPRWIVTLPFLGNIAHLDNTFSCALIVLWSVLAGVGFATAAGRLGTREARGDLIVGGLLLGALVFGWIAFRQAAHRPIFGPIFSVHLPGQVLAVDPFIWDYLAALLVASVALALLVTGALRRGWCGPGRALLIAACGATLLWRHGLHANSVGFEAFTCRPSERVDFHARSDAIEFVRAAHAREPGRGFGFQGNFFPGWTGAYGLETVHGPDALVNPFLRELVTASGVERLWDWRIYVDAPKLAAAQPLLDALNVRFYFDLKTADPVLAQHLRLRHRADLDVYESPTAWPRAFFTDRVETYAEPAELIAKFRAAAGRPFAAIQANDTAARSLTATISSDKSPAPVAPATAYRLTENTTSFTIRANAAGAVVLLEAFWPGDFRAELNGQSARVIRINHAMKGVVVPAAGEYRVTFRYWPKNFPRNLILCGLGAVLGLTSLAFTLRPCPRLGGQGLPPPPRDSGRRSQETPPDNTRA